jgi:acylphosphatase
MAEKSRVHIIVSGRVQGVCFRDFTQQKAESLELTGWVKNILNNRVEIIVEGEKRQLLRFVEHVKIGPEGADVKECTLNWDNYVGEFSGFKIVY